MTNDKFGDDDLKNFYSMPERKIPITSCVHGWKEDIKPCL
jgi:hypothetical protein